MIRNISPIFGFGLTATKVNISLSNFQLGGTSCEIVVSFLDSGGNFIAKRNVPLAGQAYADWGTDDEYIVQHAAQHCGFQVI